MEEMLSSAVVNDFEMKDPDKPFKHPWQTDTSLGNWHYRDNDRYRSAEQVVRTLTSIVANNGNMLLNVAPKGDGTIDERQRKIVEEIGAWLKVNGEAIFATRPWRIAKEDEFRFTRSKTGETLYVISLAWPADGKLTIQSLAKHAEPIAEVSLLGYPGQLNWRQTDNGLVVNLPAGRPCEYAYSVRVKGRGKQGFAPAEVVSESVDLGSENPGKQKNEQEKR
jgi:alpha-L-fucosidase